MNLRSKIVPAATLLVALAMAGSAFAQSGGDSGGGTSPVTSGGGSGPGAGGAHSSGNAGAPLNIPLGPPMHISMPADPPYAVSAVDGTNYTPGVDEAAGTAGFTIFSQAMTTTGLFATLRGPGPFTIFAPTDGAFARIDRGPLADLLAPDHRDRLQAVLAYHVVPMQISLESIRAPQILATLAGPPVIVARSANGSYTVNGANVVERDVPSGNGYVNVIDSVLFPGGRGPRDYPRDSETQTH